MSSVGRARSHRGAAACRDRGQVREIAAHDADPIVASWSWRSPALAASARASSRSDGARTAQPGCGERFGDRTLRFPDRRAGSRPPSACPGDRPASESPSACPRLEAREVVIVGGRPIGCTSRIYSERLESLERDVFARHHRPDLDGRAVRWSVGALSTHGSAGSHLKDWPEGRRVLASGRRDRCERLVGRPGDRLRLVGRVEGRPVARTDQVSGAPVVFDRATGMGTYGVVGHDRAVAEFMSTPGSPLIGSSNVTARPDASWLNRATTGPSRRLEGAAPTALLAAGLPWPSTRGWEDADGSRRCRRDRTSASRLRRHPFAVRVPAPPRSRPIRQRPQPRCREARP